MTSAQLPFEPFLQKEEMKERFELQPAFKFPHRIEAWKILRITNDVFYDEFRHIVDEMAEQLEEGFVSTNSDFWTCGNRRDSFGALIATLIALLYHFKNGRTLFI